MAQTIESPDNGKKNISEARAKWNNLKKSK